MWALPMLNGVGKDRLLPGASTLWKRGLSRGLRAPWVGNALRLWIVVCACIVLCVPFGEIHNDSTIFHAFFCDICAFMHYFWICFVIYPMNLNTAKSDRMPSFLESSVELEPQRQFCQSLCSSPFNFGAIRVPKQRTWRPDAPDERNTRCHRFLPLT